MEKSTTANQQMWLEHLRRCQCAGETLSEYAAAQGLKLKSFYNAKSRLMHAGLWPRSDSSATCAVDAQPQPTRFVRTEVRTSPAPCRVRLSNGVEIELALSEQGLSSLLQAASALR